MDSTGYAKPLDDLGRVLIPKKIRKELALQAGDMLEMFYMEDKDDNLYLCLKTPHKRKEKILQARDLLRELGIPLPEELDI